MVGCWRNQGKGRMHSLHPITISKSFSLLVSTPKLFRTHYCVQFATTIIPSTLLHSYPSHPSQWLQSQWITHLLSWIVCFGTSSPPIIHSRDHTEGLVIINNCTNSKILKNQLNHKVPVSEAYLLSLVCSTILKCNILLLHSVLQLIIFYYPLLSPLFSSWHSTTTTAIQ